MLKLIPAFLKTGFQKARLLGPVMNSTQNWLIFLPSEVSLSLASTTLAHHARTGITLIKVSYCMLLNTLCSYFNGLETWVIQSNSQ